MTIIAEPSWRMTPQGSKHCVVGIRTDLRLCERKRSAVETKQPIFTNLNRWMLWHLRR